jgi:hypothetical protein
MQQYAEAVGRDPAALHFSLSASIGAPVGLDQVKRYPDAAWIRWVSTIPCDAKTGQADVARLAEKIVHLQ